MRKSVVSETESSAGFDQASNKDRTRLASTKEKAQAANHEI